MRGLPWLLILLTGFSPLSTAPATAQDTQIFYLSGTDADHTVLWDFKCSEGRRCGDWSRIPVPSQWEQEGFGSYNYGHDEDKADEVGEYRTRFRLPEGWIADQIDLVFEGVMTDTEVRVNGELAGAKHQGGFYRFRYNITELIDRAGENLLEVKVWKRSASSSVEAAERDADYWVFGGIFRPVRLEGLPFDAIEHVAYDPRHDGRLNARVRLRRPAEQPGVLRLKLFDADGRPVDEMRSRPVLVGEQRVDMEGRFPSVLPWSAEHPHLYTAELALERGDWVGHRTTTTLGFRTVQVDPEQGLLINGQRVRLKGVNRHAFWPRSGRTVPAGLDASDARRIKDMNMNAVRMSHYPPNPEFLAAADRIGLYVLNELAGWHDAYDTRVGRKLVRSMVERDVNHPSIIFWCNGNEDGWNTRLDGVFGEHDPQKRRVLHPRSLFEGIDTMHYLSWDEMVSRFDPDSRLNRWRALRGPLPLVMPTEILHGLYDGGSAAGLEDYWRLVRESERGMGLFLWAFTDEAVERTDLESRLDTDGNHAPDGVLGPYRETSGNEWAIRRIFAPVTVVADTTDPTWKGLIELDNRLDHTDLKDSRIYWWLLTPEDLDVPGPPSLFPKRPILNPPSTPPGEQLQVQLPLPDDFRRFAALHVQVWIPNGGPSVDFRAPLRPALDVARRSAMTLGNEPRVFPLTHGLRLGSETSGLELDGAGNPVALVHEGRRLPLPLPHASGQNEPPEQTSTHRFTHDRSVGVVTRYRATGDHHLELLRWQVFPSGWIRLSWQTRHDESALPGLVFPWAADVGRALRWIGSGPTRIWGNRPQGFWGRHRVSSRDAVAPQWGHEPQFHGYYAARQGLLETPHGDLHLMLEQDRVLGLWRPAFPDDSETAVARTHDPDGFAVLESAPAIGTKFHPAEDLGPSSRPQGGKGLHRGAVWLHFGTPAQVVDPQGLYGSDEEYPWPAESP